MTSDFLTFSEGYTGLTIGGSGAALNNKVYSMNGAASIFANVDLFRVLQVTLTNNTQSQVVFQINNYGGANSKFQVSVVIEVI